MEKWRKTQKGWESCHITKQISREVKERKQNGWSRSDSDAGQIKEGLPMLSKSIGQRQHQRSALSFKTEPPFISLLCSDTKQEWPVWRVPRCKCSYRFPSTTCGTCGQLSSLCSLYLQVCMVHSQNQNPILTTTQHCPLVQSGGWGEAWQGKSSPVAKF